MMKSIRTCLLPLLLCCLVLTGCQGAEAQPLSFSLDDVPAYSGEPYVVLDDNEPAFSQEDRTSTTSFESYSPLDALGRCGTAYANVGTDLMPTEDRGEIGQVKPTGWHTVKYDCVDGKYLYNRCHLIGYQLTGENANEENLITGTRYLNVDGMLPFENLVADYVQETDNHVLYRVTPVFEGDNLVASGVQMEAWSVEDEGDGVCFNVYVYNVQPGVTIDYATGEGLDDIKHWINGRLCAFCGNSGVGKSTLLKIMNGDYTMTSGRMLLNGAQQNFTAPKDAIDAGISVIYQERQIVANMTVAENVFLGNWLRKKSGLVDYDGMAAQAKRIIDEFGLPIDPNEKVKNLSAAYQQMVEIMKA